MVKSPGGDTESRVRCWLAWLLILAMQATPIFAQVRQTPTPIAVSLSTSAPPSQQQFAPTVTITLTATPPGPVLLEALESAGNVNVRAAPDVESERLGAIAFGTQYPALRQFFLWYELQYEDSPNGRAWVFGELVEIIGDASRIQVVDTFVDAAAPAEAALEAAPGAAETIAANARVLNAPTTVGDREQVNQDLAATALPTFTYPPNFLASTPAALPDSPTASNTDLPPLFFILMLGGFGMFGLLVYSIRR